MKLKIAVYPNNELRATFYHERRAKDESADSENGLGDSDDDAGHRDSEPLDITSKSDPSTERPGYGGMPRPTHFGNAARRTLSRSAGVLEKDGIPPSECLFLTGTIPGSTLDAFDAVACWSSWILHEVKKWINKQGVTDNLSMYVWEFQSRGALHLHYFVHIPDEETRTRILWKWAIKWAALINEVGNRFGCDIWERRDGTSWNHFHGIIQAPAQFVKKSVGAYLSKYLSKNAPTNGQRSDGNDMFLGPVRWWGVSRPLLKRLNELTETFEIEGLTEDGRRTISEQVKEEFKCSGNEVHSYWDKGFNALTILTYSPKWCQNIYNRLWRDLYAPKLEQLTRFRRLANGPTEETAVRATGTPSPRICDETDLGQLRRYLSESLGLCVGVRTGGATGGADIPPVKGAEERTAIHAGARLTSQDNWLQLQLVAI
jgi:hypothetical protein